MGWCFSEKPDDVKADLMRQLTHENELIKRTCLDLALTINVAYAAVELIDKEEGSREVIAVLILIKYIRGEHERFPFGTKEMDETWGPNAADCPKRILNLLTATNNENALDWRERCRIRASRRPPPIGTKVCFENPIRFTDGVSERHFTVVRHNQRAKRLLRRCGGRVKVERRLWLETDWEVVSDF